jgi:MoxR-like ATPase
MPAQRSFSVDDVLLMLPPPTEMEVEWIGQEEVIHQLMAAWMVLDEKDLPLNPRLVGNPGMGKTTCAYAAGLRIGKPVYLFQATVDTRPEDLIVMPVLGPKQEVQYMASTIVAAAVNGGVCVLDEGNRMNEKSWASLAPLLDHRRYLESMVTGVKIPAHPDFRFVTTMNEDASTYDLPEYIHSRLQPQIHIDFPEEDEERAILKANIPFADEEILTYVLSFLARAHNADERYTVRDGINIVRYAMKLLHQEEDGTAQEMFEKALRLILGEEALPYVGV